MKRTGFSLIECMIYCCMMMLLSFFATEFFTKNYLQLASFIKKNNALMSVYAAHDLLSHDIACASDDALVWNERVNELICKTTAEDVAWRLTHNALYRVSGQYDYQRHEWYKKNTALIALHVNSFACQLQRRQGRVISVQSSIGMDEHEPINTTSWISQRIVQ